MNRGINLAAWLSFVKVNNNLFRKKLCGKNIFFNIFLILRILCICKISYLLYKTEDLEENRTSPCPLFLSLLKILPGLSSLDSPNLVFFTFSIRLNHSCYDNAVKRQKRAFINDVQIELIHFD